MDLADLYQSLPDGARQELAGAIDDLVLTVDRMPLDEQPEWVKQAGWQCEDAAYAVREIQRAEAAEEGQAR